MSGGPDGLRADRLTCLIIRLIIQTTRRDWSGSVWTDEPSNVSSPDPSGADQIDAEQATGQLIASRLPWQSAWQSTSQYQTGLWRSPWIWHLT